MRAMNLQTLTHLDQRYMVIGLGLTGYSVACYLLGHGYDCVVQDDRERPPFLDQLMEKFPLVTVIRQSLSESVLRQADCLVVSPGLSIRTPLIKKVAESGVRVIGDIELFAEAVQKPVLAITGSNGKSTVTQLLGDMIAADDKDVAVGGNIGIPALELLQRDADFYVLELSSFQLETTHSLRPLASTVLNLSEDHMDRYDDLADYQRSKHVIYQRASHCISNLDDALTRHDAQDIHFSLSSGQAKYHLIEDGSPMLAVDGEGWLKTSELKVRGRHNWANCLAAMALAQCAGISRHAIVETLKTFRGLPHRSQWVAEINGVNWINDSKGTNPGATRAAVEGLDGPVILIAGGQSKGASMSPLCEALREHVKTLLLFGQDADIMQQSLQGCTTLERMTDLAQAVLRASELAKPGDVVLLSPACASFDMYSGFVARGEHFISLVEALQ